jgi:hypothetical protein
MDKDALIKNNEGLRWLVGELAAETVSSNSQIRTAVDLIKRRVDRFDEIING